MHLDKKNTMKISRDLIKNILIEKLEKKLSSELDEGRPPIYSDEDIKKIACNYETRRDFMQNDKKIFFAAKNRRLLDDLTKTCNWKTLGNKYMRMVYLITWPYPNSAVYVGLTCDIDKRTREHADACHMEFDNEREKDTRKKDKFIKEHGMGEMTPLTDYISSDGAACLERAFIQKLREVENDYDYFKVLNSKRSSGGEMGHCKADARDIISDFKKIMELKIKTDKELELKLPDVYDFYKDNKSRQSALNRKYATSKHDVLFPNARKETLYLLNRIKNYNSKEEFKKERYDDFRSAALQLKFPLIFPEPNYYINLSNGKEYKNLKEVSEDLNVPFDVLYKSLLSNNTKEKYKIINSKDKEEIVESKIIKILKEETSKDSLIKGIDIVINALKEEYPFVVGWEFKEPYEKYKMTIYIDLLVDYDKTKEYYGLEPRKSEIGNRVFGREHYLNKAATYPVSAFEYQGFLDAHAEYRKIADYVSGMYDYIPDELKILSAFGYDEYKELNVDNFIFVDEKFVGSTENLKK